MRFSLCPEARMGYSHPTVLWQAKGDPMRRSVSVVATLACVTLAGCAGSVSDGSNGSEDDSAFTVAEPVAARQSMARLVPGGTVDVDALASAPAKTAARDPLFLARL